MMDAFLPTAPPRPFRLLYNHAGGYDRRPSYKARVSSLRYSLAPFIYIYMGWFIFSYSFDLPGCTVANKEEAHKRAILANCYPA